MDTLIFKIKKFLKERKTIELNEGEIAALLEMTELAAKIEQLEAIQESKGFDLTKEMEDLRSRLAKAIEQAKLNELLEEDFIMIF